MPSRRTFLATASLVLAGCTTGPATTSTETDSDGTTRPATTPPGSRTTDQPGSRTDDGETTADDRTPPSGDAVAWTLDVGAPVATTPALDADAGVLYVAAGAFDRGEKPSGTSDDQAARDVIAASADDGAERWRYAATVDVVDLLPAEGGAYAAVGWPTWP